MCPELVNTQANNSNYALLEEQYQGVQLQRETQRNTEVSFLVRVPITKVGYLPPSQAF
jgi:hypothetical protein